MNPSCLSVEKAIIFFKSLSIIPVILLKIIVIKDTKRRVFNRISLIIGTNRIVVYTPAVTKVEEWTKEDTGVGADIAAGSQDEKGN